MLPPPTKRYTLVLDLDETLIHSHVQFKKQLSTRAQQQQYYEELQQKFLAENGREPTKEEVENMALEMVFNIRPFAEEFLNIMSKQFELTVFTAGEQDVSITDTLIQIFINQLQFQYNLKFSIDLNWRALTSPTNS